MTPLKEQWYADVSSRVTNAWSWSVGSETCLLLAAWIPTEEHSIWLSAIDEFKMLSCFWWTWNVEYLGTKIAVQGSWFGTCQSYSYSRYRCRMGFFGMSVLRVNDWPNNYTSRLTLTLTFTFNREHDLRRSGTERNDNPVDKSISRKRQSPNDESW